MGTLLLIGCQDQCSWMFIWVLYASWLGHFWSVLVLFVFMFFFDKEGLIHICFLSQHTPQQALDTGPSLKPCPKNWPVILGITRRNCLWSSHKPKIQSKEWKDEPIAGDPKPEQQLKRESHPTWEARANRQAWKGWKTHTGGMPRKNGQPALASLWIWKP